MQTVHICLFSIVMVIKIIAKRPSIYLWEQGGWDGSKDD